MRITRASWSCKTPPKGHDLTWIEVNGKLHWRILNHKENTVSKILKDVDAIPDPSTKPRSVPSRGNGVQE